MLAPHPLQDRRPMAKQARKAKKQAVKKAARKPGVRKSAVRKAGARKGAAKRSATSTPERHVPTPGLYGCITHTELASNDPGATRTWCAKVLGWTFRPPMPTPSGDYHLFAYSDQGGGGVRSINPPEIAGSIPYIHVADAHAAYAAALREGAEEMLPPMRVMEGVTVAIVRAPGGVPIGISGP